MPDRSLRIACFEPWLGGSHRSFLDEWAKHSRHQLAVHGLAPRHWKWRQESSAWELARKIDPSSPAPDLVFCSDYIDLPRLVGFLPPPWRGTPTLAYFHENQLTYPVADWARADHGPGFSNVLTAIRADALAFNSEFHRREFGGAGAELLRRLPSPSPRAELATAVERAVVIAPAPDLRGVPLGAGGPMEGDSGGEAPTKGGPLRVLFPHRLEADKDPSAFCRAVVKAAAAGAELEVILTGSPGDKVRSDVAGALDSIAPWIAPDSGYAETREAYLQLLATSDIVVSTARHEFFGIAFAEAMAAGCTPLAPARLSYPELIGSWGTEGSMGGLYSSESELPARLTELARGRVFLRTRAARSAARDQILPYDARISVPALDDLAARTSTILRHPQDAR